MHCNTWFKHLIEFCVLIRTKSDHRSAVSDVRLLRQKKATDTGRFFYAAILIRMSRPESG
ncbi:hypothetical protein KY46_02970 [Photobacterium halotolerans]|uniref:Uncharacterized protein n=1 Tax=Photobacterium halotolerans TaxID=265726 RepID=A0A0F5VIT8_9GAMM|nr:hypothetical protein KY46_02970 [Photobacterium halotolerans]